MLLSIGTFGEPEQLEQPEKPEAPFITSSKGLQNHTVKGQAKTLFLWKAMPLS